jgi:hypothetical protein
MYATDIGLPTSGTSVMSRDMSVKSAMRTTRASAEKALVIAFSPEPNLEVDDVEDEG